jgi:mono/diheme cytochrome c family protein
LIARAVLLPLIALILLLAPATRPSAQQTRPSAAEDLFNTHCGICHSQMGPGTIMLGRRLGWDHALLNERQDLDAGYIKQIVRNGIGGMPPQTRVDLPNADLDSVAAYLTRPASERGPPHGVDRRSLP